MYLCICLRPTAAAALLAVILMVSARDAAEVGNEDDNTHMKHLGQPRPKHKRMHTYVQKHVLQDHTRRSGADVRYDAVTQQGAIAIAHTFDFYP